MKTIIKDFIFSLITCLCLTGCITYHTQSFPEHTIENIAQNTSIAKEDITFSIVAGGIFIPDYNDMASEIKEKLKSSGLFNKVKYTNSQQKGQYHFVFRYRIYDTERDNLTFKQFLSALTVFIIPSIRDFYVDATITVFKDDKKIFTASAPQKLSYFNWLPFIVAYPFSNPYIARWKIIDRSTPYFLNELVENNILKTKKQ